jgi:uncharacterized protein (DUF58 family)
MAFAGVLPLPWLTLSVRSALWPYSFLPAILFLICLEADAFLARPRRQIAIAVEAPEAAYIGESIDATVTLRRDPGAPNLFEAALDLSGDTESQLEANPFPIEAREVVKIQPHRRGAP